MPEIVGMRGSSQHFQMRADTLEYLVVAADHESQGTALGPSLGTGARSIQVVQSLGGERPADLAAGAGRGGAGIRDYSAAARPFDEAVLAQDRRARHGGVAHA